MQRIYLDNNATTQLDPAVLKAMLIDLEGPPANPSSLHWFGQRAAQLLREARESVSSFFNGKPSEVIFTSGGTEAINLFLRSLKEGHLITSSIEHACIYNTAKELESQGIKVTYLKTGFWGAPTPEDLAAAITPETKVIALSAVNNETGIKLDLEGMAEIALHHQIPLLIDAVCLIGKEPLSMHPGITAVAISGHKFHAPKGVGALFVRNSYPLRSLFTGGFQESSYRAGTENISGILGLAKALDIVQAQQTAITEHIKKLQNDLERELSFLRINGEGPRVCNTTNFSFPNSDGETLLIALDRMGIAVSHGSACSSGGMEPSRVLLEMGIPRKQARASLRFSLSKFNTMEEIKQVIACIQSLS